MWIYTAYYVNSNKTVSSWSLIYLTGTLSHFHRIFRAILYLTHRHTVTCCQSSRDDSPRPTESKVSKQPTTTGCCCCSIPRPRRIESMIMWWKPVVTAKYICMSLSTWSLENRAWLWLQFTYLRKRWGVFISNSALTREDEEMSREKNKILFL